MISLSNLSLCCTTIHRTTNPYSVRLNSSFSLLKTPQNIRLKHVTYNVYIVFILIFMLRSFIYVCVSLFVVTFFFIKNALLFHV